MFLLHINDIEDISEGRQIKLFANDCLLYRKIDSLADAERLEDDMQSLVQWTEAWQMTLNVTECHILKVCKKKHSIHFKYKLNDIPVSEVDLLP